MRFNIILCISLLIAPNLSIANEAPVHDNSAKRIIVTLPPLSGLVAMLLPEITSQCLLTASADPHHFQPSPKQVTLLNQGHLLIRASYDDQGWPIRTQQSSVLELWPQNAHGWLEFDLVRQALPQLAKTLSQQFPLYQKEVQERLAKAQLTVNHIEAEWEATLSEITAKGVFIQHPSWLGLLRSKQVPVWKVLESHQHGHEHGPRHLEQALQTFKLHPDAVLIGSKRHSNRSLEWLNSHQEQQHPIIKLDALGSCNTPWDTLMTTNLEQLRSQL